MVPIVNLPNYMILGSAGHDTIIPRELPGLCVISACCMSPVVVQDTFINAGAKAVIVLATGAGDGLVVSNAAGNAINKLCEELFVKRSGIQDAVNEAQKKYDAEVSPTVAAQRSPYNPEYIWFRLKTREGFGTDSTIWQLTGSTPPPQNE